MSTSFVNVCESVNYKKLRNFGENVVRFLGTASFLTNRVQQGRQSSATILEIRLNDVKKSLFLNELEEIRVNGTPSISFPLASSQKNLYDIHLMLYVQF